MVTTVTMFDIVYIGNICGHTIGHTFQIKQYREMAMLFVIAVGLVSILVQFVGLYAGYMERYWLATIYGTVMAVLTFVAFISSIKSQYWAVWYLSSVFFLCSSFAITFDFISDWFTSILNKISRGLGFLRPKSRIIGGEVANIEDFPYQVSVRDIQTNDHYCGGTIVSKRLIVTAAHCMDGIKSKIKDGKVVVTVGTNEISGGVNYNVDKAHGIIIHNNYNSSSMVNDIAILIVDTDIQFNTMVRAIDLEDRAIPTGTQCLASGWGYDKYPPEGFPKLLQKLSLKVMDHKECKEYYELYGNTNWSITENQLCTSKPKGTGVCGGDSGGPLVTNNRQIGVVSWGMENCDSEAPAVFTKISAYRQWIIQHMSYKVYSHYKPMNFYEPYFIK
ncbi:chymotrypsin-2-like [Oppia nitens]|uniref:chymotrypsin-2-like n=1 Tax=Oppia nitens TaxID=1686743 RepID=UPI0023D9A532|nr:chymotrypsin-2-like [Oppia nitens]